MALWSWHRVSHKILNLQDSRVFVEHRKQKPYRCLNYTLSRGSYKRCVHTSVCTAVREKHTHAPGPRHVHVTVSCWEGKRKRYWANTQDVFEATFLQIPELPGGRGSWCRHNVKREARGNPVVHFLYIARRGCFGEFKQHWESPGVFTVNNGIVSLKRVV